MQREAKKREHEQGLLEQRPPEMIERKIREHDPHDDRHDHVPQDSRQHENEPHGHRESRYGDYRPDQYEEEYFERMDNMQRRNTETYPRRHRNDSRASDMSEEPGAIDSHIFDKKHYDKIDLMKSKKHSNFDVREYSGNKHEEDHMSKKYSIMRQRSYYDQKYYQGSQTSQQYKKHYSLKKAEKYRKYKEKIAAKYGHSS